MKRLRQTPEKLESLHKTFSLAVYKNYREDQSNQMIPSVALGVPFLHRKSLLNN
ncbi:MAG: hypothetical protein P8163_05465 [Candidatus Thiodiazotropha sp.]